MTSERILERASSPELTRAVEENLFAFVGLFGLWDRAETYNGPDMRWILTDVPFPLFNGVVAMRLEAATADAAIASLVERAHARGVPLMTWTGPSARPADLGNRLVAAGFIPGPPTPGMALDLRDLGPTPPAPEGFAGSPATDDAGLRRWSHVAVGGFEMPAFTEPPLLELCRAISAKAADRVRNYVGLLNGAPVAVSTLVLGAGVAGIYNVATLPQARRLGIGRSVTHLALADARAAGYRFAILHASEDGAPLYRKMGFREVCTLGTYVWPGRAGG